MFGPSNGGFKILSSTVKAAAVVGGLSYVAANWLSTRDLDQTGLSRLASSIANDPVTTGSIGSGRGPKIDPCVLPRH